jgi:crossover junction endonuclease MUS81
MNGIEIIIDSREVELLRILPETLAVKTLDVGDIQFRHNGKDVLLLERKTVADLAASIKDGRYHEQKARLLGLGDEQKIGYLIEGRIPSKGVCGIGESTILSAIVNTFVRDRITVFRTFSIDETAKFLLKMGEKIGEFGLSSEKTPETREEIETKYLNTISRVKKANMTHEMCYRSQLCQIPGVSANMAKRISKEYPSMEKLMNAYRNLETEKEKGRMIADLIIPAVSKSLLHPKKGRKIGPKVSERVYQYLFGIEN